MAKEAFGSEAQQFIDKAIYAKMPDHVKKILNRAYLEDKPYNDIVLHLEREMRLNGLGAPDEVTLVPLKKNRTCPNKTRGKTSREHDTEHQKRYCFYCNKIGHFKAECQKLRRDKWQQTRKNNGQSKNNAGTTLKCDTCGKPHKTEDCWNGANSANDPRPKRHFQRKRNTETSTQQSTTNFGDESKNYLRRACLSGACVIDPPKDPPTTYTDYSTIECVGTPTEDWLRQQALASKRRPIPQPEREETYTQDKDYRDDRTRNANPIVQFPCPTKEQTATTQIDQNENVTDDHPPPQTKEANTHGPTRLSILHDEIPTSLNSIKEYITEKDGDTYIPLHSTIVLKNRRRMLYLPLEFGEIIMDGLVDSGAFINAMSWSDYNAIKMNSDNCVIK